MKSKSKYNKLRETLEQNLLDKKLTKKDIDKLILIINQFEKDNLALIEKLNRVRLVEINRINGALKQTINAHGAITKILIGSASKRIWGSLLDGKEKKKTLLERIIEWIKK